MPSNNETPVQNDDSEIHIDVSDIDKKKKSKKRVVQIKEKAEIENIIDSDDEKDEDFKIIHEENEDDEDDDDDDDEDDDEDDDDDDDDDEDGMGITDISLYNILGNFLTDEEGNTIGMSLSNIAKELNKLNHIIVKNFVPKESKKEGKDGKKEKTHQ